MSEYAFRAGRAGDEKGMRPLWRAGFGDDDGFLARYEREAFRPERVELVQWGEELVSMATVLPGRLRRAGGEELPGGCVYGVATMPAHRGRGLAGRLLARALARRLGRDMAWIAVVPDTPELFAYYARVMNAAPAFYAREPRVTAEQLSGVPALAPVPAETEDYLALRRSALRGRTYVDWDRQAAAFAGGICRDAGGGLLRFPGAPGCCAAAEYRPDGSLLICELLAPEERLLPCLAGLFARFRAKEGTVRLPAWSGAVLGADMVPFGMVSGLALPPAEEAYLGFDFD